VGDEELGMRGLAVKGSKGTLAGSVSPASAPSSLLARFKPAPVLTGLEPAWEREASELRLELQLMPLLLLLLLLLRGGLLLP